MKFQEQLIGALDSIFLALVMVWTIGIAVALVNPETVREPKGSVEIYTLVPVDNAQSGV